MKIIKPNIQLDRGVIVYGSGLIALNAIHLSIIPLPLGTNWDPKWDQYQLEWILQVRVFWFIITNGHLVVRSNRAVFSG